jgi:DNA polymerase-3 subunit beta
MPNAIEETASAPPEAACASFGVTIEDVKVFKKFLGKLGGKDGIVPTKTPKEILKRVLLHGTSKGLAVTATDLECGLLRAPFAGATVEAKGKVAVDLKLLDGMLGQLGGKGKEPITLSLEGDRLACRCGRRAMRLPVEDPDEMPHPPEWSFGAWHAVRARDLVRLIARTLHAADPESYRYALGGMFLDLRDGKLFGVCTDGRRLESEGCPVKIAGTPEAPTKKNVVPIKACKLLASLLEKCGPDDVVRFAVKPDEQVWFRGLGYQVWSRCQDGQFPRYTEVFPTHFHARVTLEPCGPLRAAVDAMATFSKKHGSDQANGVIWLRSAIADGQWTMACRTDDGMELEEAADVDYYGPEIRFDCDPGYLSQSLAVHAGTATLSVQADNACIEIRSKSHVTAIMTASGTHVEGRGEVSKGVYVAGISRSDRVEDVILWTTAPAAYNGFNTVEVSPEAGKDSRGNPVRKVSVKAEHREWQEQRYGSGSRGYADPDHLHFFVGEWAIDKHDIDIVGTEYERQVKERERAARSQPE